MSLIESIRRDREIGTAGPWVASSDAVVHRASRVIREFGGWTIEERRANARRYSRVPEMEAALLAAEEMREALGHLRNAFDCADVTDPALDAYEQAKGSPA